MYVVAAEMGARMRILLVALGFALTTAWATHGFAQTGQRSGRPTSAPQQPDKAYGEFARNWALCFRDKNLDVITKIDDVSIENPDASIKGCDAALLFPSLSADGVRKLQRRRAILVIYSASKSSPLSSQSTHQDTPEARPKQNVASSNANSLARSGEALLDEPLNRHFLIPFTFIDCLLFFFVLIAVEQLQQLWRRLKGVEKLTSPNASAGFAQAVERTISSATERQSAQPHEQIIQSNPNLNRSESPKLTVDKHPEHAQQAKTIHLASPFGGGSSMQLKLRRSQRTGGLVSSKVFFTLDARADLLPEEKGLVSKYGLGKLVVYDSDARKKHQETA